MIDYTIFYKKPFSSPEEISKDSKYDIFVSGYTDNERVLSVYEAINSSEKQWLIFPEYKYQESEYPTKEGCLLEGDDEAQLMRSFLDKNKKKFTNAKVCIDITGFIRPHLLFLLIWFMQNKIKKFDVIYSEPSHYKDSENTRFSDEIVVQVRQVIGFEGNHKTDTTNDILILGSGYDHELISQAAESKNNAKKIQIFGLPSLRPHMYQENVLRAQIAKEAVGVSAGDETNNYFAPAYDPFVTANVISEIVQRCNKVKGITNLYLCPLATKPQVLGFALYYLNELRKSPSSIIYPFHESYSKETSVGISRIWRYTIELPEV